MSSINYILMMAMLGVASGRGLHFQMIIVLNSKHEPLQSRVI